MPKRRAFVRTIRHRSPGWSAEADVPAVVAEIANRRGICDPDAVRLFLDPKLNGLASPTNCRAYRMRRIACGPQFLRAGRSSCMAITMPTA